jgi:hypothetical protein
MLSARTSATSRELMRSPHYVLHQVQAAVSFRSQDRLRMKLHGFHRQLAVAQAHDDAVVGLGGDFQARRGTSRTRVERMIAAHLETLRQSFEHTRAASAHPRRLAVHGVIEHAQLAAERLHHALQSQAHAEHRNAQPHRLFHQIGHAEIGGTAGAGRNQNQVRRDCWRSAPAEIRRDTSLLPRRSAARSWPACG